MTDENQPGGQPPPLPPPSPPQVPPGPLLDYRRAGDEPRYQPRTPFSAQVVAGFAAWILGVVSVISAAVNGAGLVVWALGGVLISLGGLAVWLRLRFRWRGFLPGLLIGFGLTCLVPIGIVAVICGMHK